MRQRPQRVPRVSSRVPCTDQMLRRAVNQLATSAYGAARTTGMESRAPRAFTTSAAHATTVLCVRKDGEVRREGTEVFIHFSAFLECVV